MPASGEIRWPSSPMGKLVGMRVPGIHSSGRRIQSLIQSWRRRVAAICRFGASVARSTPGAFISSFVARMALLAPQQLEDLLARRPARRVRHVVRRVERIPGAVEGREVPRQVVQLFRREAEGRHVGLEPRADLAGPRRLEEGEEPVALNLGSLALDDRRRERRVGDEGAEGAPEALDDVAALAVVVLHDPPAPSRSRRRRRRAACVAAGEAFSCWKPEDRRRDAWSSSRRREPEVRHPQLLFPAARAVPVEDARVVELRLGTSPAACAGCG